MCKVDGSKVDKLTVVQIIPSLQYGGVEKGTLEIAKSLIQRGHRSIVIAGKGPLENALKATGCEYIPWEIGLKKPKTLKYIFYLARFLKKEKPNIVHVRSRFPAWITQCALRFLKRSERPKIITTVHGLYHSGIYSGVMVRSDCIIAVSETAKSYILKNYAFVDPNKIQVIYRGIDPTFYYPSFRPQVGWQREWEEQHKEIFQKILLTLPARVSPTKGIEDFIRLILALKKKGYPVHGLVVGGAYRKERYQKGLMKSLVNFGLTKDISFLGARGDLREIMAISKIVFSLSKKPESFGRTVVEAVSLGVPVIGYNHGGVGEVLARIYPEGGVEISNQNALLEKTISFLECPPIPALQTLFLTPRMVEQTIALYKLR